ncbi:MAG: alpha-ketoacid dehydrogenase subunit beta [Eubacteriales bacterium]|nr:alpha-ketoacid dehydrogenase subunit beta [Eubacteriales bacterium]
MGKRVSFMNAIRDGIAEEMRKDPTVVIMGEGVGERGGSYGHTKNLWQEFGAERVIDTPISENGFTGMAVGAAATGLRPIVDIMFADILYEIMSQVAQQAGKLSYMSAGQYSVPMVIRAQMGCRITGPHHSACLYALCMHVPGLKVVVPGNAYDAKGLMKTAIRDDDPVVFFEHKFNYAVRSELPEEEYYVPFDKANILREGKDITVVSIGPMQDKVLSAIEKGLVDADVELIDPRVYVPLNFDEIRESVKKTGRLVIVEEGYLTCGAGAEIAARVSETVMGSMKAPIVRVAALDIPHPYAPVLEHAMIPDEQDIADAVNSVMSHK